MGIEPKTMPKLMRLGDLKLGDVFLVDDNLLLVAQSEGGEGDDKSYIGLHDGLLYLPGDGDFQVIHFPQAKILLYGEK